MSEEAWTIGRLLSWTAEFFGQKKIENPRLAAEVLLSNALGCQRIDLYTRFEELVTEAGRSEFRSLVKRHANGEPVAYLVGQREFYSLSFVVNRAVLIPRPETEQLVSEALDRLTVKKGAELEICDVGTGSGAVAVCLAKYLPQSQITAIDISPEALEVARGNAEKHLVSQRIRFHQGDLLSPVTGRVFDAIVSNPPYVSEQEFAAVPNSVRDYEPRQALVGGGPDGGETTRKLIDQSSSYLKPGGWLLFETSPMLAPALKGYVESQPLWSRSGVAKDTAGLLRVVWAQKEA